MRIETTSRPLTSLPFKVSIIVDINGSHVHVRTCVRPSTSARQTVHAQSCSNSAELADS